MAVKISICSAEHRLRGPVVRYKRFLSLSSEWLSAVEIVSQRACQGLQKFITALFPLPNLLLIVGWFLTIGVRKANTFSVVFFTVQKLSTGLRVKGFIKLKMCARALRFSQPAFHKGCRGISVSDNPNGKVSDNPNETAFWVSDNPNEFTG